MITTKKGKKGVKQLDYSYSLGISNVSNKLDVLTGDEYRKAVNDLGLTLDDKGDNADWQDRIFAYGNLSEPLPFFHEWG